MRTLAEGKTEELECLLTSDEYANRANALAQVCQDVEGENIRQAQVKAGMKAELSRLEAERSRFTLIVARKAEPRAVRVMTYADDEKAEALVIREDTGEIIRRRALSLEERQPVLPFQPGSATDEMDSAVSRGESTMRVQVGDEWRPATLENVRAALASGGSGSPVATSTSGKSAKVTPDDVKAVRDRQARNARNTRKGRR